MIPCPGCDQYHDSPNIYCNDCCADLRLVLESGEPEIMMVVSEWLATRLTKEDMRPEQIECPKCMAEFKI